MSESFDPLSLTEDASLNSLRLADLPGADPTCVGRQAFDVLSLPALQRLATEAGEPGMRPAEEAAVVSWLVGEPGARAQQAIDRFGRRLGHLIATLTVEHAARAPASSRRNAYLDYWLTRQRAWLAGGIVAGLGSRLLAPTRAEAARLGSRVEILEAPHAGVLALVGAARRWPSALPVRAAAVLDCGHTAVKRAVAEVDAGGLARLLLLPPQRISALGEAPAPLPLAAFVVEQILRTLDAAARYGPVDSLVRVSVASYVRDGQPISSRGIYGRLPVHTLEADLRARAGQEFRVRLDHDGTLAAAGLDTPVDAAVIVLGTSLGSGFPPPPESLLPLAPDFATADL